MEYNEVLQSDAWRCCFCGDYHDELTQAYAAAGDKDDESCWHCKACWLTLGEV